MDSVAEPVIHLTVVVTRYQLFNQTPEIRPRTYGVRLLYCLSILQYLTGDTVYSIRYAVTHSLCGFNYRFIVQIGHS